MNGKAGEVIQAWNEANLTWKPKNDSRQMRQTCMFGSDYYYIYYYTLLLILLLLFTCFTVTTCKERTYGILGIMIFIMQQCY